MPIAPTSADELDRLRNLHAYEVLDTPPETVFDELADLAATITGAPAAMVSLVDADRQWCKATVGGGPREVPRALSFCGHAIRCPDLFVVPDATRDERFADLPWVRGEPHRRFYAGAPLVTPDGHVVGTLCVLDGVPRQLTAGQAQGLRVLARQVVGQLELRRATRRLAVRERAARAAAATDSQLAAIVECSDDAILSKTLDSVITTWNRGAERIFGWSAVEVVGGPVQVLIPPDRLDEEPQIIARIRSGERVDHFETVRQTKDGRLIDVSVSVSPVRDDLGQIVGVSKVARDITLQKRLERERQAAQASVDRAAKQLWHDAHHDALTGLPNRVLFAERVERSRALALRPGYSFALLFLDLDRFKVINDSLGHAAGDKVLTTVAARVRACLRPADVVVAVDPGGDGPDGNGPDGNGGHTVARMGGDEFTILLEHLRSAEDAARVAERVRLAVAEPIEYDGHELTTTASIGIVTCRGGAGCGTAKELIRDADAAMYQAKGSGKDRYVIFDPGMHAEVVARMTLEADLRRAVGRGELELHYQPIVSLAPGGSGTAVVGFEALARWRRDGRLIPPAEFIPVAEDSNLIVAIGTWALRTAARQLAGWRRSGGPMADLYVNVNVSRRQLADPALTGLVRDALHEAGLPPAALGLEVTESVVMSNALPIEHTLVQLRHDLGVRVLLDDFGTGHSSLACLRRFPVDVLKIDRAFIRNVTTDVQDAAVAETIVTLAHRLGMSVVAEGIEAADQAAFLSAAGCDRGQGYLFSRPLEAAAVDGFVRARAVPVASRAA